jgi:HPt (histidine-containing phosphotransfer) domain-containing protein
MHEAAPPILERRALERLRALQIEGEPDLVAELAGDFLARAPQRLERMRASLAAGNASALDFEAHTLAGGSGMLGLKRLHGHCQALEARVRDGTLTDAAPLLAEVERAFAEARVALLAEVGEAR